MPHTEEERHGVELLGQGFFIKGNTQYTHKECHSRQIRKIVIAVCLFYE